MLIVQSRNDLYDHLPKGGIGMEAGVHVGHNAWQLRRVAYPKILYLVDAWDRLDTNPWFKKYNAFQQLEHMWECANRFKDQIERELIKLVRGRIEHVLPTFPHKSLDWIYVDDDHSYEACKLTLRLANTLVKDDGVIAGHDYVSGDVSPWAREANYGVVQAVNEFMDEYGWYMAVKTNHVAFDAGSDDNPSYLLRRK